MRTLRLLTVLGFAAFCVILDGAPERRITTHTFKRVGALEIKADVHEAGIATAPRPVVVWIHGGGLINGGRERDPNTLIDRILAAGCCLVSIDYRLAPETKLPGIVEDVGDAFRWIRRDGPQLFHADPERIGVVGTSAGGYLALVAGYRVQPRPRALVSFWGYGNLIDDWYALPSKHARHQDPKLSAAEAWAIVSGAPVANGDERRTNARAFYQFCRQQGLWPKAVSGWDPRKEADRYTPFLPVRNVSAEFPPTFLVHGTDDSDVPHLESAAMAAEFRRHGVRHQLLSVPRGEHGLQNLPRAVLEEAHRAAADFLLRELAPAK